jgi:hypothetical protein
MLLESLPVTAATATGGTRNTNDKIAKKERLQFSGIDFIVYFSRSLFALF